MNERTHALCAFLDEAHSPYHAIASIRRWLMEDGYTQLDEGDLWNLVPGGRYFLCRGGSSVIAFRIPEETPVGFTMSASHSDRPTFLVREDGELVGRYTRLSTEKYGGMLIYPWLDRPLSIAGRALVQTEDGVASRLIDIDRDIALIPSLAIHMDRNINESHCWDPKVDTVPLLGSKDVAGKLPKLLEEAAGGKILSHDLFLYVREPAKVWGIDREYLSAPALDDLECVFGCTQGFLKSRPSRCIPVLCVFDNEEVGSNSVQGADSQLLSSTLDRICRSLELDIHRMLSNSFMISADNSHAVHPNRPELSDPTHPVELNGGVVIKFSGSKSYTSDGLSAAVFRKICAAADVPTQTFYNRPDMKGGGTLGHISLNHVSVPTVDIGLAQLAMHSCYETAGTLDPIHLENAMSAYYSTTLQATPTGYIIG